MNENTNEIDEIEATLSAPILDPTGLFESRRSGGARPRFSSNQVRRLK
jgi:hypothetical protein